MKQLYNQDKSLKKLGPKFSILLLFVIFVSLFLALFLYFSGIFESTIPLQAEDGQMSLVTWDFKRDGPVQLKGDWEFYWRELWEPTDFSGGKASSIPDIISLPNSWNGYEFEGEPLTGDGYATFRLTIIVDEELAEKELAVKLPSIFTAYKLWVNGHLLTSAGRVGQDAGEVVPQFMPKLASFQVTDKEIELVLQIANFDHRRGGLTSNILLGTVEQIVNAQTLKIGYEMFVAGCLIFMGMYNLLTFAHRTQDKVPLYFGLFALVLGLRSFFVGELLLTKLFPDFPYELEMKIEYVMLYIANYLFAFYIRHMFPQEMPNFLCRLAKWLVVLFSLFVLLTSARVFTHSLFYYQLIIVGYIIIFLAVMFMAVRQHREGALLLFLFSLFLFFTVISTFLFYGEQWLVGDLSAIGLLIFTFAQIQILSLRFATAFNTAEQMSIQLQETNDQLLDLNKNLEQKVEQRTQELSLTNQELQQSYVDLQSLQANRRQLLEYIAHDLRTPITIANGYLEVILDNLNPQRNRQYLLNIQEKVLRMNEMIEDLYYLAQLEADQIPFQLQSVLLEPFMQEFYQKYKDVVEKAGLSLHLEEPVLLKIDRLVMDPNRMEQVFANLIGNALKFTKPGGFITLGYEYVETEIKQAFQFKVKDTGIGIAPEDLPHIFERYYKKYRQESRTHEGSGLGLIICKKIVEYHHGEIWAESRIDEGSTIYISLPLISSSHF